MIIAIPTEGKNVFQHYGKSTEFTLFDVEDEMIVGRSSIDTAESGHGALTEILSSNKVNIVICGGIGSEAKNALREKRIEIVSGVNGPVDEVIVKYLSGEKIGNPEFECNDHHHSEGHICKGNEGHSHHDHK